MLPLCQIVHSHFYFFLGVSVYFSVVPCGVGENLVWDSVLFSNFSVFVIFNCQLLRLFFSLLLTVTRLMRSHSKRKHVQHTS